MKKIYYLTSSWFCFWVKRAIDKLNEVIKIHANEKIYCVHELVHNSNVNNKFKELDVTFVEDIKSVKNKNAIIVFSAHWTNRKILKEAKEKFKMVYNLECPLVSRIYNNIDDFIKQWINTFFYIGKRWHQEAQNILDYMDHCWITSYSFSDITEIPNIKKEIKLAVVSQTTLNFKNISKILKKIKTQYPRAVSAEISDICMATFERQWIITNNLSKFETLVVVGWKNSNNTKELVQIWNKNNKQVFFVRSLTDLIKNNKNLFKNKNVAITGWASTPNQDIRDIFDYYKEKWYKQEILSLQTKILPFD